MTSASKHCWLHIGAPKTGSTAIQRFLTASRETLAARGCLYPQAACRARGHPDLAFLARGGYPHWATPQERDLDALVADLRNEIESSPQPNIVLSSENFYLLCPAEGAAALMRRIGFAPDRITVVAYLRRQDEAAMSWYNQAVKAQGYA